MLAEIDIAIEEKISTLGINQPVVFGDSIHICRLTEDSFRVRHDRRTIELNKCETVGFLLGAGTNAAHCSEASEQRKREEMIDTITNAQEMMSEALALIEPLADANKQAYIIDHLRSLISGGFNRYDQSLTSWLDELENGESDY